MTQPEQASPENPERHRRFDFRNPSYQWRIFLVAVVLAVPGTLAGMLASIFFGEFIICSIVGALVGALFGALMEAWPPPASQDGLGTHEQQDLEKPNGKR